MSSDIVASGLAARDQMVAIQRGELWKVGLTCTACGFAVPPGASPRLFDMAIREHMRVCPGPKVDA